jgi:DNA-binding NarL/FixJ family response regulator
LAICERYLRDAPARIILAALPDGRSEEIAEPLIPLLDTALMTNAPGEPRVGQQVLTEVPSADRIDLIMAFIRHSGIAPLVQALRRHCAGSRALPVVSAAARAALRAHRWPGNVRELDNLAQRSLVLLQGDVIGPDQLHFESCRHAAPVAAHAVADESRLGDALRARESRLILQALAQGRGSRKSAAGLLGISPRTIEVHRARIMEKLKARNTAELVRLVYREAARV